MASSIRKYLKLFVSKVCVTCEHMAQLAKRKVYIAFCTHGAEPDSARALHMASRSDVGSRWPERRGPGPDRARERRPERRGRHAGSGPAAAGGPPAGPFPPPSQSPFRGRHPRIGGQGRDAPLCNMGRGGGGSSPTGCGAGKRTASACARGARPADPPPPSLPGARAHKTLSCACIVARVPRPCGRPDALAAGPSRRSCR